VFRSVIFIKGQCYHKGDRKKFSIRRLKQGSIQCLCASPFVEENLWLHYRSRAHLIPVNKSNYDSCTDVQ